MAKRITEAQAEQVRRLLSEGVSRRTAAREVGMSRTIVDAMANGKWRCSFVEQIEQDAPNNGPVARCKGCGGLVHMPCVKCKADRSCEVPTPLSNDDTEAEQAGYTEVCGECGFGPAYPAITGRGLACGFCGAVWHPAPSRAVIRQRCKTVHVIRPVE